MSFTWEFGKQFAIEFKIYPNDQQDKIIDFIEIYTQYGLSDFSKFPGKISPSWKGTPDLKTYTYAKSNHLWHYHLGLPEYIKSRYFEFFTSDWVLHFQWKSPETHIVIVDILFHYKADGEFHLPTQKYLERV
ncbi:hypothetical protein [Acinetobacter sp. KS-LM10]|uniref:hypothetical protein n=1 Tax=Acinetobacter sp. KS-LM10 TaxID=3120518 RepID=UPI0030D049EA